MVLILRLCAAVLFVSIAHCIPIIQPCLPELITSTGTIVGTTVIDNSVSNALANALQLLIVSNLIENTINGPGCCSPKVLPAVASLCETIPIKTPIYPPAIEVVPEYIPPLSYNCITPCDIMGPREAIEVIPNVYYPEILSNVGCNCYDTFIPDCGCNIGTNCGCGIPCNCGPNCAYGNLLPNLGIIPNIGLPDIGCGCKNFGYDPYNCICDKFTPMVPETIFPTIPTVSYNYGCSLPSFPMGVTVDPWGFY